MYSIVDDGDKICIRATISQRWELAELVTKLQARVDGLPVDITTYIEDVPPAYAPGDTISVVSGGLGATATIAVAEGTTFINPRDGYVHDAQDVNRKELSNE